MVEKHLNEQLGNLFSVNLILVCSQSVKELGLDLAGLFRRFTHVSNLNGEPELDTELL